MKLEDLIEGLNRHIDTKRKELNIDTSGHLVLQKTVKQKETFKAYKEYNITVWFVKGRHRFVALMINHVTRVIDGMEERVMKDLSIRLSEMIFNWMGSNFYSQIIKGEYNGYEE